MKIVNYTYKLPDLLDTEKKAKYISSRLDSKRLMSDYNWKTYQEEINTIKPTGKTAVLYIGGAAEHHSLARTYKETTPPLGVMPVQSQMGYTSSRVAKHYGASYLSINANACASSMYALYEAQGLLDRGFDDVIIYGEEWVEQVELLLFKKMGIDVTCSDAFSILHLQQGDQISDVNWIYYADKNPFFVSKEGYMESMKPYKDLDITKVKTHGTQTGNNTESENAAIEELFGSEMGLIEYKKEIGHTQGCSTMVEISMLLDREAKGKYLVNASGLGNFYGSCTIDI